MKKHYSEELRRKVNHMYCEGYYVHEIAKALKISEFDVDEILGRNR